MDMEKTGHSSSSETTGSSRGQTDHMLKQLNKSSHKIAKPQHQFNHQRQISQPTQHSGGNSSGSGGGNSQQPLMPPPPPPQPPVYNINKNDFRDVVQKLTGSPAHDRLSTPPPIHAPKPQSSRLQKIRPPPLANVTNRPPPALQPPPAGDPRAGNGVIYASRPRSPFSPLPPLPGVAAAESPISAYMRFLQNSMPTTGTEADPRRMSGLFPRWDAYPSSTSQVPLPSSPPVTNPLSAFAPQFLLPGSSLGFGHMPSPRFQYPLLSPSLLFSPISQLGLPPLPVSPRLPVTSPRWKDL